MNDNLIFGLNGAFPKSHYLLEKDIIRRANLTYQSVLMKKKGYMQWLTIHKLYVKFRPSLRIYYATFTFDDNHLEGLKMNSFIKYLRRNGVLAYRFNYDKGELNERLHLHGFIVVEKKINNKTFNLYGFTKMVLMSSKTEEEEERICKYIVNYVIKNDFFSNKVFTRYLPSLYNDIGLTSYNI